MSLSESNRFWAWCGAPPGGIRDGVANHTHVGGRRLRSAVGQRMLTNGEGGGKDSTGNAGANSEKNVDHGRFSNAEKCTLRGGEMGQLQAKLGEAIL
jgi:hypothetical protein